MSRLSKGFTLIELLVVIALIGILATFGVANFTIAQAKARDAQRKNDLAQIGKALELYRSDTVGAAAYPKDADQYNELATKLYIKVIPADPKNAAVKYCYIPAADWSTYDIYAIAENQNDPEAKIYSSYSGTDCVGGGVATNCSDTGKKCFKRSNP